MTHIASYVDHINYTPHKQKEDNEISLIQNFSNNHILNF
jgi:hypothetical protein